MFLILQQEKTITHLIKTKEEGTYMQEIKLHDGELNIMELLWSNQALAAKDIAKIINEYVGWQKNTTYTVIKRLIEKGAIVREDPGFICRPVITKRMMQQSETQDLLCKFYDGSMENFIAEYIRVQDLSASELELLEKVVKEQKI